MFGVTLYINYYYICCSWNEFSSIRRFSPIRQFNPIRRMLHDVIILVSFFNVFNLFIKITKNIKNQFFSIFSPGRELWYWHWRRGWGGPFRTQQIQTNHKNTQKKQFVQKVVTLLVHLFKKCQNIYLKYLHICRKWHQIRYTHSK